MQEITVVYWRDIPAQLLVGRGRKALKYKLPAKYEKAIDMCAMKTGAREADTYLQGWRKFVTKVATKDENFLEREAEKLMKEYDDKKLKFLINNNGWEEDTKERNL